MQPRRAGRTIAVLLAAMFFVGLLPVASANPMVPYCQAAGGVGGGSTATRDQITPELCEQVTGRVFPEAIVDEAYGNAVAVTDFIGYFEFQAGLEYLAANHPQYVTVHEVAMSAGQASASGTHDSYPIYIVELTNKESPIPMEERQDLLFMLSIHGNEKGGREGGFRVLEDLTRSIGFAAEGVQDGAGLPEPIPKADGSPVETYFDYLDFMRIFLLFPNVDGWVHDEAEYAFTGQRCGTLFCRTNGNGVDLNRQAPTLGWQNPNRNVVGEPEAIGYYNWMLDQGIEWDYAIDIHGMLNHQNFVAIMLPAASMTPQEMHRSTRLAETLKERLNGNDHFAAWEQLMTTAETAGGPVGEVLQDQNMCAQDPTDFVVGFAFGCDGRSPTNAAGSSVFAEYYTVIDAIGYTDSGFNGDYFAQDTGLNAPGYDIELAYNHITFDSQYEAAALFNDYHVKSVREIVKSFMDAAALDVQISYETGGQRTLYLEPTFVATNLDDDSVTPGGWADENAGDDLWGYSEENPFFARPAKYWEDLKPFVRDGDSPGVLVRTSGQRLSADQLSDFDTFVIPGSAISTIESQPATIEMIKAWVEDGGKLVLTDSALQFFDLAGITDDAVDMNLRYMGGIRMDLDHPLLDKVRGGVKQTYEPTPLGYAVGANAAPNWAVDFDAFTGIGGSVAGIECGTPRLTDPCEGNGASLGEVAIGSGMIRFIGSLLPDPTEEFYHPYGLDHYATTYSGNQVLRNLLGWEEVFEAPPVIIEGGQIIQTENEPVLEQGEGGSDESDKKDTPALGVLLVMALLGAIAVIRRR